MMFSGWCGSRVLMSSGFGFPWRGKAAIPTNFCGFRGERKGELYCVGVRVRVAAILIWRRVMGKRVIEKRNE